RCPHECTKQTLAGLRPRGTGGPGRGYERCRVARPEHLNPWRARRTSPRLVDFERAGGRHAAHPQPDGIFGGKDRQQIPPSSCSPSRQLRTASRLRITSVPSRNGRGRRTEWRASNVKWKDDTRPPANIFPTIIFLIYIAREIALQDHRAEIVAEEAAHRELALLLIA